MPLFVVPTTRKRHTDIQGHILMVRHESEATRYPRHDACECVVDVITARFVRTRHDTLGGRHATPKTGTDHLQNNVGFTG